MAEAQVRPNHWHRRERNRRYIYEFLSKSECIDCGLKDIECLQIDHQRDKLYDLGGMVKNRVGLKTLQKELDKCHVVCANCHMRRTSKTQGWYVRLCS